MKCKIIFNPRYIPTFEHFEKIEEFEYDGVLELLQRVYQPSGNICYVLNCENGKLYRSENNVFCELGIISNYFEEKSKRESYCCDECLLQNQTSIDDKEICKDLMLDEVISSQKLEIERLTEIVQDLVTTNLKLVEMLALKK